MAEIPAIKRRLVQQGVDVIDVGAGDADFAPPEVAVEALAHAIRDPAMSRYAFQLGLPAFREAAAAYMKRRFGVRFDPFTELHPLLGSKEGIAHLAMALLDPGDVAIVPEPGYAVYEGGTVLAGAEPYRYALTPRTGFLLELDEIPTDVLHRAKLVYLNYPNNPTATIAPREYLARTVAFCRRHGIVIVYDNPYCEITFDGHVAPSIFEIAGARDIAVEFHSLSKTFCMTGWRLAWAAGRPELIAALGRVKNYVDTGAFLAVQAAGAAVLPQAEELAQGYVARFRERRDAMLPALRAQGFEPETPEATMYVWVPLPEGVASAAFARRALTEVGVVTLAGSGFGAGGEGVFRIALTVDTPRVGEAAARGGARRAPAHPGPGRQARLDARREPPGGGPPYREPAPGGRWSALGVAAPRAADRSRRRAVRAAGEPRHDGGAPAPRHGRLAQRRHRSGSAIPAAPGLDHGRGREGVRHRLAVHPRGGDQDSHGRPRAPADHPAAGELRRATAGTPAGRDAGGLDAGGPAHRDPAALQAVRARPAGAEASGA